jgi:hypothetical protein
LQVCRTAKAECKILIRGATAGMIAAESCQP